MDSPVSDNQYLPGSQDVSSETKTLPEVLRIAMDQVLRNVNKWLPCQVTRVENNSVVDVQPCIKENFRLQGVQTLPIIPSIPVQHPRGAGYFIKLPVKVGDYGRVVFADRSLDNWLVNGGVVDPQDVRIHDLSDAVFIPGLFPLNNVLPGDPEDLVINNGEAEIIVKPNGTFQVTNGTNELLNILNQISSQLQMLASTLSEDTVNTSIGPQPLNAFETYETISEQVQELIDKLQTLEVE